MICDTCIHNNVCHSVAECLNYIPGFTCNDYESQKPTDGWIPVSEGYPEEETDVLICNIDGDIIISRGSFSTEIKGKFMWYTSSCSQVFGKVIAWQPLPEPYKKGVIE